MKYAQPPKTSARIYIPTSVQDGPLYVCEGEKKTLAAIQVGLNSVGIGGVWNWANKGKDDPINDLILIKWEAREVTIIPDSDVWRNVKSLHAIYTLGCELRALSVNVVVAQIPQAGIAKVGLDDFLVAGGDVQRLEVFSLGHRILKSCKFWHSRWKFLKATKAAA
jgi:Domain of unknown function (DUF3854)